MKTRRLTLIEYQRVARASVEQRLLHELQRFDEHQAHESGQTVFDWTRRDHFAAQNYVGVIEVPGLHVEILPKIDDVSGDEQLGRAQNNLLWMLHIAGELPFEDRRSASHSQRRAPLLEALVGMFVQRLLMELRRGVHHTYVYREDRLSVVRGRLLVKQQICQAAGRDHQLHVGYDEFVTDNLLNRILKAACRALLPKVRSVTNQTRLREALVELESVDDVIIRHDHFDRLNLDRTSRRFDDLLRFARLVLRQDSVTFSYGPMSTFSLLFPMEAVFEKFIGRLLVRHADRFGWDRQMVHLQAAARRKWLLQDFDGVGRFRLKPDVVVDESGPGTPRLILDTKWKRLVADVEDKRNGISQADLYQMYAYANRYDCRDCVLLYPSIAGVSPKTYRLAGCDDDWKIRIATVNLNRDLPRERERLVDELAAIVSPARSLVVT